VSRQLERREQLLAAALSLFDERGYHATSINDIGAAAGLTGPAIYRYFASKDAILETLLLDRSSRSLGRAQQIVDDAATAADALNALITHYVSDLLNNPELSNVAVRERFALRGEIRGVIERSERMHVNLWVKALRRVRPELSDGTALAMIHGVISMTLATAATQRSGLDRAALEQVARSMIKAALAAEVPRTATVPRRVATRV
jgi:AcrR family transcriptional regulator